VASYFSPNTLLIGNYNDSLSKIYSSSYCVGYEDNKSTFSSKKESSINNLNLLEFAIDGFYSFFTKDEYKTVFNASYDMMLKDLKKSLIGLSIYGKKYLEESGKQKLETIIFKLPDIKIKVNTILNDNQTLQPYMDYINDIKLILNDII